MSGLADIPRRALERARELLREEPVLVLAGPRTVGKSYVLQRLARGSGTQILDLDDVVTLQAVSADPGFYAGGPAPVCIDEWQHCEAIVQAIKAELNRDLRPGRFVLTGSTRSRARPILDRELAGRYHEIAVLPFSQGELAGVTERFAELLVENPESLLTSAPFSESRSGYAGRVTTGGMPLAVARSSSAGRNRWFDDYVPQVIERDARALRRLTQLSQRDALPRVLARLASQTAQILDVRAVAERERVSEETAGAYVRLLADVHLVQLLPAWGTTLGARIQKKPKVHLVDTGLAARLLRVSAEKLAGRDPSAQTEFGHLLETFVVGEVMKQLSWTDSASLVGHWNHYDAGEVDLVVERDDGRIVGIEVKAASSVSRADTRGLRALANAVGDRFAGAVLLNLGQRCYRDADGTLVMPVERLWSAGI